MGKNGKTAKGGRLCPSLLPAPQIQKAFYTSEL